MKLTNQEVVSIYRWLNVPLHGEELRSRVKFIGYILPQTEGLDAKRLKFCEGFADKDEDGKPILEKGQFKMTEENTKMFGEEYQKLLKEEKEYEIDSDNKKHFQTTHTILSTKVVNGMGIDEGAVYDTVLNKFETCLN